ncbi:MAG: hypothetical protein KDA89_08635 [Planctomycetaceae bacterium]|nr:hypothetical protein [Planctomycetaceae bacterium]
MMQEFFRRWSVLLCIPHTGPRRRRRKRRNAATWISQQVSAGGYTTGRQASVETLEQRLLLTLNIQFDYSLDTSDFFAAQSRRDVLEEVASVFEARITDDLAAITPGGSNSWTAVIDHPSTGQQTTKNNLVVPADTVIVYVGARDLTSGLGLGGPGGFSALGNSSWLDTVETRGEPGALRNSTADTDYGPWGGSIAFDNATNWNFSLNEPASGQNDFYAVALHEMAHVLGFGTSQPFSNLVNGFSQFTGTKSTAAFGGSVPMASDRAHFASNTMSTLPGTNTAQEAAMDPQLTTGTRKHLTVLDWAALDDIGWDVAAVADPPQLDFGDAPDTAAGTGPGNYNTTSSDNGPSHQIVSGLFIGTTVDGDDGTLQNSSASADDASGGDDEDFTTSAALNFIEGLATTVDINVTNTTGTAATLYGWIDFNGDGAFSNSTERASAVVATGTNNGTVTLTFPETPDGASGSTFLRLRLSTEAAAANATGPAADGEVEDHPATLLPAVTAYDSLPSFHWTAVPGAVRYEVQVDRVVGGPAETVLRQSYLTGTSYRPPAAFAPGTYTWKYRAHDGTAFLPFSQLQTFTVYEKTGVPLVTDPVADGIDSRPTIAWSPIVGAVSYDLDVTQTAPALHREIVYQEGLSGTSFTPDYGLPAGSYTVRVRALVNGSPTDWSSPFLFDLANSADSVLTDPVAGSSNPLPVFSWLPMNVSAYTLRVDNLSTATPDVLVVSNLTGTHYIPDRELPAGNYSATIQGGTTAESTAVNFQIEYVSGQAQLTLPSGDSENPLPAFAWTDVLGATRYELWVNDLTRSVTPLIRDSTLTTASYRPQQPLLPGDYRVWVRAFNGGTAIGLWSTPIDFTVRQNADIPKIWAPSTVTSNTVPTLAWSSVAVADSYSLTILQGAATITRQENIATNSLSLQTPLAPGTYTAQVTEFQSGIGSGTDSLTFTVEASAAPAGILGPAGNITNTRPLLTWTPVTGATRYFLWVNDDTRSIGRVILENNVTAAAYAPVDAMLPGTYRYWVRAFNGATPLGNWSSAQRFTITTVNDTPVITSPTPNTTSTRPTFTWTAVTNAASYEIVVDNLDTNPVQTQTHSGITTTSIRLDTALSPGNYAVRVRSFDVTGAPSQFSDDLRRTVEWSNSATRLRPLFRSSQPAANAFFVWTGVETAVSYELWISNLTTSDITTINNIAEISYTPPTALTAGSYRAWVRAIGPGNVAGAWSTGQEFTLTAVASPQPDPAEEADAFFAALELLFLRPGTFSAADLKSATSAPGPESEKTSSLRSESEPAWSFDKSQTPEEMPQLPRRISAESTWNPTSPGTFGSTQFFRRRQDPFIKIDAAAEIVDLPLNIMFHGGISVATRCRNIGNAKSGNDTM